MPNRAAISATLNDQMGVMTKDPKTATKAPTSVDAEDLADAAELRASSAGALVADATKSVGRKLLEHPGLTLLSTLLVFFLGYSFADLNGDIGRLDSRIDRLEAQIDQRFAAQDAKFEARFEAIDRRFEAIDATLNEMNSKINETNLKITALIAALIATAQVDAALEGNLVTLEPPPTVDP